ncbi:MAG: hypothetical protein MJZ61_01235 [Bacteroidales bacterium]|nr:hypothetical protein [Bacteroidales bacterium]
MDKAVDGVGQMSVGMVLRNFIWDIVLMLVLVLNLFLICWDWFFSIPSVYGWFMENTPSFFAFYNPLHADIRFYDLIFVAIYALDVVVGWCVSVFRRKERLFEYPVTHWYDIIGCVPAGSLVFLRLLRIVSIVVRLYKKKMVDLTKFKFFRKCVKIYNIIMEEISDRVVLNILSGIKSNIQLGMPITSEVINKIVIPHKTQVIDLVFSKLQSIATTEYGIHRHDLAMYISEKSRSAIANNKELARLRLIPVFGAQIQDTIEQSVSQTMVQVVDGLVQDVLSDQGQQCIKDITCKVADQALVNLESDLSKVVTDVVCEVVDLIARTANIKQWKLAELRDQINIARAQENPDKELIEKLESDYQLLFVNAMERSVI